MQFTRIITAVFVAAAVAAPTGGGSTIPATGDCNSGQGSIVCCNGILGLLDCVVGICGVGGGNAVCCQTNQAGLINISLLSCLAI